MKKNWFLFLCGVLIISVISSSGVVYASDDLDINSTDEQTVIYDKNGEEVMPVYRSSTLEIRGTKPPTSIKWLNNTASYQSAGFSGKGSRYGGYQFNTTNKSSKYKLTFKKGGFAVNTVVNPNNPSAISETFNLALSGSPYTMQVKKYFHFAVDNPKSGQTYKVNAIK